MERRTKALDLCIKNALKQCDPVVAIVGRESRCDKSGLVAKWRVQVVSQVVSCSSWVLFIIPRNRFFIEDRKVESI